MTTLQQVQPAFVTTGPSPAVVTLTLNGDPQPVPGLGGAASVVNSLSSTDPTVALAAAQGPAIVALVQSMLNGVQTMISNAIAAATPRFTTVTGDTGTLPAAQIVPAPLGGNTFPTVDAALAYVLSQTGKTSATEPTPNAAPTVAYSPSAKAGATGTITPGTYTAGTGGTLPTGVAWQPNLNGVPIPGGIIYSTTFTVTSAMVGSLTWTELFTTAISSGQYINGATSLATTIAPAVANLPGIISAPTISQSGSTATATHGTYTNGPITSYPTTTWSTQPNGAGTVLGTGLTLNTSALSGSTIYFSEVAANANGNSPVNSSAAATVAGGTAPQYVDASGNVLAGAALPFFTPETWQVGLPISIDFGQALNNPATYYIQMYRGGAAITAAGGSAGPVTSFSYTPTSADQGLSLSATVTPNNAAGTGYPVSIPGVVVGAGVAPTGVSFVGVSEFGSNNTVGTLAATFPSGVVTNDFLLLIAQANAYVSTHIWAVTTGTGWTAALVANSTAQGKTTAAFTASLPASPSAPTLTYEISGAGTPVLEYKGGVMLAYRGASTGIIASSNGTINNTPATLPQSVTFPSLTATAAGQVVVLVLHFDPVSNVSAVTASGLPAGYTQRISTYWDGTAYAFIWTAEYTTTAAGSVPAATVTFNQATADTAGWIPQAYIIG